MQANLEYQQGLQKYIGVGGVLILLCLFSFSAFAFTSAGISGKISFRFAGEENLALRQCRLLTAAVNDNFILEQQCGYNSTLPHNVYNYFHWRKDLVAFCTSFNLSCSEVLQAKLGNRPHLWHSILTSIFIFSVLLFQA